MLDKILNVTLLVVLSLLMVKSQFPNSEFLSAVPEQLILPFIIVLFVGMIWLSSKRGPNNTETIKWKMFIAIYFVLLVLLLMLLGGKSESAFSSTNIYFWLAALITAYQAYKNWKELKRNEE